MYQLALLQFSLKFTNCYVNIVLSYIHIFAWMLPLYRLHSNTAAHVIAHWLVMPKLQYPPLLGKMPLFYPL